jgi:hypothetical protein
MIICEARHLERHIKRIHNLHMLQPMRVAAQPANPRGQDR